METSTLCRLGKSPNSGWDVYSLGIDAAHSLPSEISISSKHFVCLLSWDAQGASPNIIASVAERLLELGCVYFCCWGADCERVHDIVDEVLAGGTSNVAWLDVMTTWHEKESLAEAIDFFLDSACPADRYLDQCSAALAITIGNEYQVSSMELAITVKLLQSPF